MDPGSLSLLIPIVAIAAWSAVKIARIMAQGRAQAGDPQVAARLAALEEEVGSMRQELSETHERLDFTERLLTQQRSERLDPPK
jgi:hypothetical protein